MRPMSGWNSWMLFLNYLTAIAIHEEKTTTMNATARCVQRYLHHSFLHPTSTQNFAILRQNHQ